MNTLKPQLVHETEIQRQHVRVELPAAQATFREQLYSVHNISVGGLQLIGVEKPFQKHEKGVLSLALPFEAFTLNLDLPCEVEHYDAKTKTLGCAFTALTDAQMSLLSVVIKSRMAGTIIDAGDILHIAGRSNLVKFNRDIESPPLTTSQKIKRSSVFSAFALLGLLCVTLISVNLYERLNIVKTSNAFVYGPSVRVKAPVNGEFQSMLGESITKVRTGQRLGQIKTYLTESTGGTELAQASVPVLSPCDCFIVEAPTKNGEFRVAGEPIMTLLPLDQRLLITATLPISNSSKIRKGQASSITVNRETVSGTVQSVEVSDLSAEHATIKIKPDQTLPLSLLNTPVSAEIRLR